jgi:hypothetical protein
VVENLGEIGVTEGEENGLEMGKEALAESADKLVAGQLARCPEGCLQTQNQIPEPREVIKNRLALALANWLHLEIEVVGRLTRAKEPE